MSSWLWSDPVGARQLRAQALRRRAPLFNTTWSYVKWHIHMCNMAHALCSTWRIHVWNAAFTLLTWRTHLCVTNLCVTNRAMLIRVCAINTCNVWDHSLTCVTIHAYMRHYTRVCAIKACNVWDYSFMCVATEERVSWFMHTCHMAHVCMCVHVCVYVCVPGKKIVIFCFQGVPCIHDPYTWYINYYLHLQTHMEMILEEHKNMLTPIRPCNSTRIHSSVVHIQISCWVYSPCVHTHIPMPMCTHSHTYM